MCGTNNGRKTIFKWLKPFLIDFRNRTLAGGRTVELFHSLLSRRKPRFDVRAQMSAISGRDFIQFSFRLVLFCYFILTFILFSTIHSGIFTNHCTRLFVVVFDFNSSYLQNSSITQLTGNVFSGLANLRTL